MNVLGLDLNASRLRAVTAATGQFPLLLPLCPPLADFPLAISLEGRAPEAGPAGERLRRRLPHLACQNFLPHLAEPAATGRKWVAERFTLDSEQALALVLQRLQPVWFTVGAAVLSLPVYLTRPQVDLLTSLADQVRLPLLGTVTAPLAAALAAHAEQAWTGTAVIVDADENALTLSVVSAVDGHADLVDTWSLTHLGVEAWKGRALNALAEQCVLQSRRDPRDSPPAEQALYDQLDEVFEACHHGRMANIAFQTATWYQHLVLRPDQPVAYCAALVREAAGEIEGILCSSWPAGPPATVVFTAAAGKLPGLTAAVESYLDEYAPAADATGLRATLPLSEDFGEGLLEEEAQGPTGVVVLNPDAQARAAHLLAAAFESGDLPCGHLERSAPLPLPQAADAGPARLYYRGQEHLLGRGLFTIGRQPGCDVVFEGEAGKRVAARHCDITYERRRYVLCNRSREGTLLNDQLVVEPMALRPGDWIRLGSEGPLVRFLGQPVDLRGCLTTA
jgi:FHA domain